MVKYEWKKEWWTSHGTLNERPDTLKGLEGCDIIDSEHGDKLTEWVMPKNLWASISGHGLPLGSMEHDAATGEDEWVEICLVKYHMVDDDESVDLDHLYVTPDGKWYCIDEDDLMPPKKYQDEYKRFMGLM